MPAPYRPQRLQLFRVAVHISSSRDKCVAFARNFKLAILIQYSMQYIPCISALLAQETVFLTQKSTFFAQRFPKVRKSRQNSACYGLRFSSRPKLFGEGPSCLRTTSATLLFFGMLLKSEQHDQCHQLSLYFMYHQAEAYFNLIYRRYLKQMVGWKRAMEVQLTQRCLIEKLQKVYYYILSLSLSLE